MKNENGRFKKGKKPINWLPVGSVSIRTRHKRGSEQRAFVKIAEPNKWVLRARLNWENANGKIPPGFSVHHKDENTTNDELTNLELLSKAEHLSLHRESFADKCIAALINARKEKAWSTKSKTKTTGRHPKGCKCPIHAPN